MLGKKDPSKSYQQITKIFGTGTVGEALQNCEQEGKSVLFNCLIILLSLLLPSLSLDLQTLTSTPLAAFTSSESLIAYMDNIIKYGVAAQLARGLIHTIGNSGSGKSSLVNTMNKFLENPKKVPTPVLTQNSLLIETQVMEVYSDLSLQYDGSFKLNYRDRLFTYERGEENRDPRTVKMNIFDLGGHSV